VHPAATSITTFGLYAVATGVSLTLVPDLVLSALGIPAPTEVWIRMVGALAVPLGYYYWACGRANAVAFFQATVPGRIVFAALIALLVARFAAPVQMLLFAAIDLAGAAWTAHGLRAAARAGSGTAA
jgi:hypothetical protein